MGPFGDTPGVISGSLRASRDENFLITVRFSAALYDDIPLEEKRERDAADRSAFGHKTI